MVRMMNECVCDYGPIISGNDLIVGNKSAYACR
jgi:hypothetical protein